MIFITGGASQGKTEYARMNFPGRKIVASYQNQVAKWLQEEKDAVEETASLLQSEPDMVILMNEMGCGITPMDASARRFRDEIGRVGCYLAKEAGEVHRVIAGIGTRIK